MLFFQDTKSSLTKLKKCLLEAFYGTLETFFLQKTLMDYNRKQFLQNVPP